MVEGRVEITVGGCRVEPLEVKWSDLFVVGRFVISGVDWVGDHWSGSSLEWGL